jgi:DNA repair exonuclease SbcCD ATPase subunit
MHIQFTKVRYKNILSVGNQFIELNLANDKTTLISGQNGSSKSTVIEAIVFALYGKPFRRINKPQLVNSINQKELLVELEFNIGPVKYIIRRGIKPGIFEIWKNDELLNKDAASRDYQVYLEQNILKMSFKSFSQIVILGSATYVPFMELPAGQRREIIEDLLDIQVFSTMNLLLKEKISDNKTTITDNNYSIDLLKTKIDSAKDHNMEIERIKRTEVTKIKSKIEENLKKIEEEKEHIEKLQDSISELSQTIGDKQKKKQSQDQINLLLHDLQSKQREFYKEIEFYSNHDNCPTCKQGIEHNFKDSIVQERKDKGIAIDEGIIQLNEKLEVTSTRLKEISTIEDQIRLLNNKIDEHRVQIKMIVSQLKSYKKELEDAEKEVDEIDLTKINEFILDLKNMQGVQQDLYNKRETLGIVASMLKDGGIKTRIIKTYIPIMNKLINQYLSEFELFVDFNLDENFNETIKSRFRDAFSFASFSEGEKMRINLSIMFTWRAVAKLRNSVSTNLLIMDETLDGPSDADGVESLIEILHKMNSNDNIFVISHRSQQFAEKFDNHIRFEKVKNFTQIAA